MKVEIPSQHRVLGRYGADAQAMVHCEELAELIQAISKMHRVRNGGQDDAEAYDNPKSYDPGHDLSEVRKAGGKTQ